MNTGQRIKKRRIEIKMTVEDLANAIGKNRATVYRYENGDIEKLPTSVLKPIADALKTTTDYLMGWDETPKKKQHEPTVNYIVVPMYAEICCGNGGFVEDNVIDYIPVPSELLNENGDYFCMVADGDSMIEAGITSGDFLIFERCSKVGHNVIGCFCIDDNIATCKKYKELDNGTIMLSPCNSNYDPIIIDMYNAENIRCVGVLRKSIRSY